ncbi:Fe-S cluster assembly protein SufD [Candidimonas nitroreducens]|uniref:Fe-S cluster assembly protein SufD n=1 Tax=Candidimonas nitroreducens TaxID=683354 RepID=A0A225MXU2_9BURK|nr:Fe-S cluster assembly protein SufD [Candidimonas nitroreducens]OWT66207.1 Fe-S cluster assembly protein SufD [Candidimonas nitroreducens]
MSGAGQLGAVAAQAVQRWTQEFARRGAGLAGARAPWLAETRRLAIERFADLGWPGTGLEDWHHTSLASLQQQEFADAGAAADESLALAKPLLDSLAGHVLAFVDGRYDAALSHIGALPAAVRVEPLAAVLEADPELLRPYLGAPGDGATTEALNLALAADGAYIHIGRGVALEAPVHLVFIAAARGASFPRNVIVAEAGAQATIVEHYLGADGPTTFTNAVTRGHLDRDARITHCKLQEESAQAFHLAATDVVQQRGSAFVSHSLSLGARLARNDITTSFQGEACETLFNGLYYADARRHVDHHTRIDHARPGCNSREYYRGILDGAARGVFAGRILVAEGADRTDAVQRSDSLLLSKLAQADTRPELEIYADDVKCAHGATVGQIDDSSLFYLRSRGFDPAHARNLLTYAFAAETLQRIELEPLRRRASAAVRRRLPGGADLEELA